MYARAPRLGRRDRARRGAPASTPPTRLPARIPDDGGVISTMSGRPPAACLRASTWRRVCGILCVEVTERIALDEDDRAGRADRAEGGLRRRKGVCLREGVDLVGRGA